VHALRTVLGQPAATLDTQMSPAASASKSTSGLLFEPVANEQSHVGQVHIRMHRPTGVPPQSITGAFSDGLSKNEQSSAAESTQTPLETYWRVLWRVGVSRL